MRYFVCLVLLALCFVAWECTAQGEDTGQNVQRQVVAPTDKSAPQEDSQGGGDHQDSHQGEGEPEGKEDKKDKEGKEGKEGETNDLNGVDPKDNTDDKVHSPPDFTPAKATDPAKPKPEKQGDGEPENTSEGQTSSKERGQPVHEPTLTTPTTIVKNNKGDNADRPPPDKSGGKGTDQQQTLKSTTTTTAEQTASTDISITSSAAPTSVQSTALINTSPKQHKIPQSADKTDGSSSISFVFAFKTLVALSMMALAPAY